MNVASIPRIIKAQIMAAGTLSGRKVKARQQYNSCIMMYINVATIPSIIKAQIMAASPLSGQKVRARQQYNSCILMISTSLRLLGSLRHRLWLPVH